MCGYGRRHIETPDLVEFVRTIEMMELYQSHARNETLEHFYPAQWFG